MKKDELEFMENILNDATWLFYGDWEHEFNIFLKQVFSHELKKWGFGDIQFFNNEFKIAYWMLISQLERLNLIEYGTSPRGCWLTEKGIKFRDIILKYDNAIKETQEYIYNQFH